MNEYSTFSNQFRKDGYSKDQILRIWDCILAIKNDQHPVKMGYSLEETQLAYEWVEGFTPNYDYINNLI